MNTLDNYGPFGKEGMFEARKLKINWANKINKLIFENNFYFHFNKCLWRVSGGNKEKAYLTIKNHLKHYNLFPDDFDIDLALGELNNGVEIEWNS